MYKKAEITGRMERTELRTATSGNTVQMNTLMLNRQKRDRDPELQIGVLKM